MSEFRRSLMMQEKNVSPWSEYVQDGLIFQLDCDTLCTADKWTDIIGGKEFVGNGNVQMVGGVPHFVENAEYFNNENIIPNTGDMSFEVVFKTASMETYDSALYHFNGASLNRYNSVAFRPYNNNVLLSSKSTNKITLPKTNFQTNIVESLSYSHQSSLVYLNKNEYTKGTVDYWTGLLYNRIGSFGKEVTTYYAKDAYVYAMRIYNRILSKDEILANQEIDTQRFQNR